MSSLAEHWGGLFQAAPSTTLQSMFSSVEHCVSGVTSASSATPAAVLAAAELNAPFSLKEIEGAVR
jgi:hypothetical protein